MKLSILFLAVYSLFSSLSLGQQTDTSFSPKENLLEKSRKQKTTGFILLGTGTAAVITGGALFRNNFCLWDCSSNEDFAIGAGVALVLAGAGSMIASIPSFVKSLKNAKKAAQLSLKTTPVYLPRDSHNGPKSHLALQLSIPLNY